MKWTRYTEKKSPKNKDLLTEFNVLSGIDNGRIFTIGCGSSEILHMLVKGIAGDALRIVYQLDGNDLNENKILPLRLPSSKPTDIDAVTPFFPPMRTLAEPERLGMQRIVAFLFGTSAGALNEPYRFSFKHTPSMHLQNDCKHVSALAVHEPMLGGFLTNLYDSFAAQNHILLSSLLSLHFSPILEKIATTPWETLFVPLEDKEIVAAYQLAMAGCKTLENRLEAYVHLLAHSGLVVINRQLSGCMVLYPASMLLLVQHLAKRSRQRYHGLALPVGVQLVFEGFNRRVESAGVPVATEQ
jgi:hypothetical protein